MEELVVVTNGDWRFLLEGKGNILTVWPYYKDAPVTLEKNPSGKAGSPAQFRKVFPYPNNYWERSTKILAWCKRFAKTRKFRDQALQEYAQEIAAPAQE